jgi:4-amino-4-deoxy-L-arabinose transferase-like glycosyltransferase
MPGTPGITVRQETLWLALLLALPVVVGLLRPLLPIDETRYSAVAWEMWMRGEFLVPHLNGKPYHHKPPLLFWLMHAGWWMFGVNDWWPRLISPLFAAGTLALTAALARQSWPDRPEVARIAPFILAAGGLFSYFTAALMFDMMLSFFVMLGLLGLMHAWRQGAGPVGFMTFGLGIGGALHAKGPVALLHLLPLALLAPLWMREQRPPWRRWYAGVGLALLGGALLILAWAVPAGMRGGDVYRNAIFWDQAAGRMVDSFAHRYPWWFHLAWLPLTLAPWLLWPRWWQGLGRSMWGESGFRLAVLGCLLCLLVFSLVSGKRVQYLLPIYPLFAMLCARALLGSAPGAAAPPGRWGLAVPALTLMAVGVAAFVAAPRLAARLAGLDDSSALFAGGTLALASGLGLLFCRPAAPLADVKHAAIAAAIAWAGLMLSVQIAMREPYDIDQVAGRLAFYEREGRPLAVEADHHGQWTFAGRLRQPPVKVDTREVGAWLHANPEGRLLFSYRQEAEIPADAAVLYERHYRGGWLAILAAPQTAAVPADEAAASAPR